jgi:hypothetical protein
MWGFGKEEKSNERPEEIDYGDIDMNIPFNEDDLNDPDLLAELAAMSVDDKPKPKLQPEPKPEAAVEIDHILSQVPPPEDDDVQVEFKEEDMNDPDLLAQLAIFGGVVIEQKEQSESPYWKVENVIQAQPVDISNSLKTSSIEEVIPRPVEVEKESRELKLKLTNIDALEQHIKLEKMQALNNKRAGDKQSALDHIQFAKRLQARIDQLKSIEPEIGVKSSVKTPAKAHEVELGSSQKAVSDFDVMVNKMEQRIKEFKKTALDYKRVGNMNKAREMLGVTKTIQTELENMASGLGNPEFLLPEVPKIETEPKRPSNESISPSIQETKLSNVSEKVEIALEIKPDHLENEKVSSPGSTIELITHLITILDTQMALLTKLAAQCFVSNEKDKALEYHKRKKGMALDKETLKTLKNVDLDPKSMPFSFKYTTFEYSINQTYSDVPLDEINIKIPKAKDIILKTVPDIETLVSFDLGWPNNNQTTLPTGKGETEVRLGSDPEYNLSQNVKIERTKSFQRFLERKKAVFEIFYLQKTMFGMMVKRIPFGKVVVKLDDLLAKREIHGMLNIVDHINPRKNTGAMLEVQIRLRAPLIKPDIVTTSEKWLLISFGEKSTRLEPKDRIAESKSPLGSSKSIAPPSKSTMADPNTIRSDPKTRIAESKSPLGSSKSIAPPPPKSPVLPATTIPDGLIELESVFQKYI